MFFSLLIFSVFLSNGAVVMVLGDFQFTFINPDHSAVKLRPSLWQGNKEEALEFQVKVNKEDGTVLTILNKKGDHLQVKIASGSFMVSLHHSPVYFPIVADGWNSIRLRREKEKLVLVINSNRTQLNDSRWSLHQWKDVWIGSYEDVVGEKTHGR